MIASQMTEMVWAGVTLVVTLCTTLIIGLSIVQYYRNPKR